MRPWFRISAPPQKVGIPRFCGASREGPIYRRLNVGRPSSEVNREKVQPQGHPRKSQFKIREVLDVAKRQPRSRISQKHTAGTG